MAISDNKAESAPNIEQVRVAQTFDLINTLLSTLPAFDLDHTRAVRTVDLVRTLVSSLPEADSTRLLRDLTAKFKPMSGPRAGEVLGAIVQLFPQRESWTVSELKQTIDDRGITATPKEVYNAVSYLARKGHVRRMGYGRYLIDGIPIVTPENMGGQPSLTEEDLDN